MKVILKEKTYLINSPVEDVLKLIEKNIEGSNSVIYGIDQLIENKSIPEYIRETLIALRDIYAINTMNIERFICSR